MVKNKERLNISPQMSIGIRYIAYIYYIHLDLFDFGGYWLFTISVSCFDITYFWLKMSENIRIRSSKSNASSFLNWKLNLLYCAHLSLLDFLFVFDTLFCLVIWGIPEFLDSGHKSWTLDFGRWTLDAGLWTLDAGLGHRTLDARPWMLKSGLWTCFARP